MRIVYLSRSVIPSRSANSIQVMKMCQAFARLGHEVRLVARSPGRPTDDPWAYYGVERRFSIVAAGRPGRLLDRLLFPLAAARRALAGGRPELLYARHLPSLLLAARPGIRLAFEAHMAPGRLQRRLLAVLLRRPGFAALVAISEALGRELGRLVPRLAAERIVVAPDAADLPVEPPGAAVEELEEAPASGLRVGFVGHLYRGKGMETIVALAARLPELAFHVVGGTRRDVERWRARTAELTNLTLHGFVTPAETDAWRRRMDVLLAPYQRHVEHSGGRQDISAWMSPLKVFEYMAAAKPIVASDLPALREILTDGETALLADPENLEAWVAALERLADPRLRERLGHRARQTFESRYTWEQRARAVLAALA